MVGSTTSLGADPDNIELPPCPIMSDNQAIPEHFVDYEGLRYYFCCDECISDFNSDPSRFAALSSVTGFPIPDVEGEASTATGSAVGIGVRLRDWTKKKVDQFCLDYGLVQLHVLAAALVVFVALILWRRDRADSTSSRVGQVAVGVGWTLAIVMALDAAYLSSLASERHRIMNRALARAGGGDGLGEQDGRSGVADAELLDSIRKVHYATFVKYGFPPRPRQTGNRDHHLSRTYYRGNDERHSQMFNGGQYRTVTFSLQLETEDGTAIDFGESLVGIQPYLRVTFERAADTSSGYFTKEYLQRMYLTMVADRTLGRFGPVKDRVPWTETSPGSAWSARYRLPEGDQFPVDWKTDLRPIDDPYASALDSPKNRYRGIVYLCEDRLEKGTVVGGRYHFGIEYDLQTCDGLVLDASNLFMGSTYEGRNFERYQINETEWLSDQPIPEKPRRR